MTTIHYICNWHKEYGKPCKNRATQIILYGCLQQHLDETLFCYAHAIEWTDEFHSDTGFRCSICAHRLEAYELIPLHKVKRINLLKHATIERST